MKIFALFLILALSIGLCAPAFAFDAQLSTQNLSVNGVPVKCEKYNIDGNNYFKLRDLAYLLSGSGSQFDVGWDGNAGVVSITTNSPYTSPNGSELVIGVDQSATAQPSAQTIMIDGVVRKDLTVYNIGGSNYFKLREMGDALGFNVDYVAETNTATVASMDAGIENEKPTQTEETSIKLDQIAFQLFIGETKQLKATVTPVGQTVTWSSGNPAIATVNSNGIVTAVSEGAVDIVAAVGDKSTFCTVTVKAVSQLTANDVNIKLIVPTSGSLNWYAYLDVTNYSSDPISVAGVCEMNGYAVQTDRSLTPTIVPSNSSLKITYYNNTWASKQRIERDFYLDQNSTGYVVLTWNGVQYYAEYNVNGITTFYRGNARGPA